jgi:hypothetical protein
MHWMDLICCGMMVKSLGMAAVSVRKMKAPTVKMGALHTVWVERSTQVVKTRWKLICFVH